MAQVAAILQLAQIVLGLFPMVLDLVKAVEAAIPGAGQGKAKFDAVLSTIEGVYNSVSTTTLPAFEKAVPAFTTAINSAVALFNTAGVFKKADSPATQPTT